MPRSAEETKIILLRWIQRRARRASPDVDQNLLHQPTLVFLALMRGVAADANVTAALRWRISPRWSTCQDFLAQMNLVASMLSNHAGLLDHMKRGTVGDGSELVIGHVDGALHHCWIAGVQGWSLTIGPVQDGLRGTDTGCMRCTLIVKRLCKGAKPEEKPPVEPGNPE